MIGRAILFSMKDVLLAEDSVDIQDGVVDNIIEQVYRSVSVNFEHLVSTVFELMLEKFVENIKQEVLNG